MKDAVVRARVMLRMDASVTEVMLFEAKVWLHKGEFQKRAHGLKDDGKRILFYLSELQEIWDRIAQCQQSMGMNAQPFKPGKDFIKAYALTGLLEKLITTGNHTFLDLTENWTAYLNEFATLGYGIDPFRFAEGCQNCYALTEKMNGGFIPSQIIPMPKQELAKLSGRPLYMS